MATELRLLRGSTERETHRDFAHHAACQVFQYRSYGDVGAFRELLHATMNTLEGRFLWIILDLASAVCAALASFSPVFLRGLLHTIVILWGSLPGATSQQQKGRIGSVEWKLILGNWMGLTQWFKPCLYKWLPAAAVQHGDFLPLMLVFQESAVALASSREPSMQGNLEENSPAGRLLLSFCSQLLVHLTPDSLSKQVVWQLSGTSMEQQEKSQPKQWLLHVRGYAAYVQEVAVCTGSSLPVCIPQFPKKSGWQWSASLFLYIHSCSLFCLTEVFLTLLSLKLTLPILT